jgi:hypothetical protein
LRLAAGEVSLGDLAKEIVGINKKLCSLEFLVLFVQAKRTDENEVLELFGLRNEFCFP